MFRFSTNRVGCGGAAHHLRLSSLSSSSSTSLSLSLSGRLSPSSSFFTTSSSLTASTTIRGLPAKRPLVWGTQSPTIATTATPPFGSRSLLLNRSGCRRHNSTTPASSSESGATPPTAPPSGPGSSAAEAAAARKKAAEAILQEYTALFRPGPQAPKEEFTARVLGAPFDVAFRGTVGVAVAVLLILVTFGVAAKISDAWDVYQLARKLLDEDMPPSPKDCFGREEDVRKMESRLGERPEFIYFVGGSPRSGLSTVVSRVLNDYAGNSYIINLRESSPMTGMEDVTHSLNKSLGFLEILPSFQSLKHHFSGWEIKGVLIPATEAQRIEALKSTLEKLTKALKFIRFLSRLKSSRTRENTYPIIAFDHFKEVMNIPESKQTLNVLLKWALYITHEAHLAHVILVSSDPKVAYALTNDELLSGRIISVNIDSIAKEPALKYLRKRLARSRYPREITEEEGEKIFSEIGSAFVDLNRVEAHLSSGPHISVDQALDIMHRTTTAHIVGALGAEGRSWTPTQLWRTIKMLAESETGELDYFQLKTTVFNGNEKVLHELFDAGILLYRSIPLSVWPTSSPNTVFPFKPNGVQMTPVVTAYTPFVMFCCKQLANDLRLNTIMNRQMADEEAAASSLAGRLSSAMMMVS